MKAYCTQNSGVCSTCSLANYGMDCKSKPIHGGKREGAGRPPTGRKLVRLYITEEEEKQLRDLLEKMRTK